ncbi:hypothetical protein [Clavibacter sp.]|uniref:hypothetical protein n=1 Tax=Clavibacter sp. TaxID=1871044 RepID=UPI0019AE027A|nr:hypothetical protein [Clavibacter sp.]MBD5381979.1 hypothetical protein [Clavibacter sp.]
MTDKIKIEDMTLGQIRELKEHMANNIRNAICDIVRNFNEQYDCGDIDLSIDTDIREFRTEWGEKFAPSDVRYGIAIKFSKEDEQYL